MMFNLRVLFDLLSRFCHSGNVGCANLMTCMGSLTLIAKFRVSFIEKVLTTLETLTSKKYHVKIIIKQIKINLYFLIYFF